MAALNNRNQASEIIDDQDNHAVLIHGNGKCYTDQAYGGSYAWRDYVDVQGWASGPTLESPYYHFAGGTFTVAGGHHWRNGGYEWSVDSGPDICKRF